MITMENVFDIERSRWLLAVDVTYYLHRFWFSGAGVEAAVKVAEWIENTVKRLKEKGLTDVACCFDSRTNNRKKLTEEWDDKYKPRPPKDPELVQQLYLVKDLIRKKGFCCHCVEGYEADDVMASFAHQFPGRVTLMTQDKDCRQCLSSRCNMLLDVEWEEDPTTGKHLPNYHWYTAEPQENLECRNLMDETGLKPHQWPEYQCIAGDNVDGIRGAEGIGEKGATDLIKEFGTAAAAISRAKEIGADEVDSRIKPSKRQALIDFEEKLETTLKLVTLVTDLKLQMGTRI